MLSIQRILSSAVICLSAFLASAANAAADEPPPLSTTPVIPNTVAGKTLEAWLTAFSSHDSDKLKAYLVQYEPSTPADEERALWEQIAGVELVAITKSRPRHIEFQLRTNKMAIRGKIDVDANGRPEISPIILRIIPPMPTGTVADDVIIDDAMRHRVIVGTLAKIDESYVFPDLAAKMRAKIEMREHQGEYDAITDADVLARRLTDDLRAVSHDKHLVVIFSPYRIAPVPEDVEWREATAEERADMLHRNCGFERVEILPHNVGYIKFNSFEDPDICGATVTATMAFVENVDALIFDLRDNGGGDPQTVQLIATYLFAEPTHLNDLFERKGNKTTQYWTLPYVPGKRFVAKPVYLLTSDNTFSAAEEFSYDLKSLKRATIVGAQTGGGAHPTAGHMVEAYFTVLVPFARPVNPVSKTDWEGVGVEPDVKVPAGDALSNAESLADDEVAKALHADKPVALSN